MAFSKDSKGNIFGWENKISLPALASLDIVSVTLNVVVQMSRALISNLSVISLLAHLFSLPRYLMSFGFQFHSCYKLSLSMILALEQFKKSKSRKATVFCNPFTLP